MARPPRLPRLSLARRLVAAARGTIFGTASSAASRGGAPAASAADDPPLFPGLPDAAALRAAVEGSLAGAPVGPHSLTRHAMYAALAGRLAAHDGLSRRCLSVSRSNRLADVLGLRAAKIIEANHPEHSLLALRFKDEEFDFCISDQVLEHVEGDPFAAVAESFRVVRPGGFVVHTTCVLNPVHREPGDFWRFTPDALSLLCKAAGGVVEEAGSWGNRDALALSAMGFRSLKVPTDPAHPLNRIAVRNEPDWPIHTWAVARKPG